MKELAEKYLTQNQFTQFPLYIITGNAFYETSANEYWDTIVYYSKDHEVIAAIDFDNSIIDPDGEEKFINENEPDEYAYSTFYHKDRVMLMEFGVFLFEEEAQAFIERSDVSFSQFLDPSVLEVSGRNSEGFKELVDYMQELKNEEYMYERD